MSKRKVKEKNKPLHPRLLEKTLGQIGKIIEEKNLKSIEETNEFLKKIVQKPELLAQNFNNRKRTDYEKAQDLIYDAWEEDNAKGRIKLAERALKLFNDCSDAYNLLAEEKAETLEEAREFFQKGVESGKKVLGKKAFDEMQGHFWGYHETRPFMRSMCGLSYVLWDLDEKEESIQIIKEMLQLNPNDNQGMRYSLIIKLLILRRYKEAEDLLNEYKNDSSAHWLYSKAYLYFKKPSKKMLSNKALIEAMKYNPYVPLYLFGIKDWPDVLPEYVGIGDENEAIAYMDDSCELWGEDMHAAKWFVLLHQKIKDELDKIILQKEKEKLKRQKQLG